MKIYNHSEVLKTYEAEKETTRFIRDTFLTVPAKGLYILSAILATIKGTAKNIVVNGVSYKDCGLQFSLIDTRIDRTDTVTKKVYRVKSFNLLLTGHNLSTGAPVHRVGITATDDLQELFLKNPKTSILCQTIEVTSQQGNKYLRLELISSNTNVKELQKEYDRMKKEGVLAD